MLAVISKFYTLRFRHLDKPGNLLLILNVMFATNLICNIAPSLAAIMAPAK